MTPNPQLIIGLTLSFMDRDDEFYNCHKEEKLILKNFPGLNPHTLEVYINGVICMINHSKGKRLNGLQHTKRYGLSKAIFKQVLQLLSEEIT